MTTIRGTRTISSLVAVVVSLGAPVSIARSQSTSASTAGAGPHPAPVVLTIEGGGSLGVYEGGLVWTLVELFRQQRRVHNGLPTELTPTGRRILDSLPPFY